MSFQKPEFRNQYENYIGGRWVAPLDGEYFEDSSPVDGSIIGRVPQSNSADIARRRRNRARGRRGAFAFVCLLGNPLRSVALR